MIKYFLGFIFNLFNRGVSFFALIDHISKVSKKAKVNRGVKIYDSNIDSFTYIGPNAEIVCADIGKFCSVANNCSIGLATHSLKNISSSPIFTARKNGTGHSWVEKNSFEEIKRVKIGNDVWIGTKVIIMGGVKIGNGAIIGAGSIVTRDLPDYSIAVGVPAKVKKFRFDKPIIDKLQEINWWDFPEEKLKEKIKLFQIENFTLDDLNNF
jgi:acetyltransferase-like isoleucine patch superfamily enzyme